MISTDEMFMRFTNVSHNYSALIDDTEYTKEYSTESIGLEIGYYSQSKADLYIKGTKRGKLINRIPKVFTGFKYCFKDGILIIASRVIGNKVFEMTFLDYSNNYCFGYTYALTGGFIPTRCFIYEIIGNRIVAFKSSNSYHTQDENVSHPAIILDECYSYSDNILCGIDVKQSFYYFQSREECVLNRTLFNSYNGKFWIPSNE